MGARSKFLRESLAKLAVALEVPLAAHRLPPGAEPLHVKQYPRPPARRARADPGVVLEQPAIDVGGPADVGQSAVRRAAAEDIDKAWHVPSLNDSRECVASGVFSAASYSPACCAWRCRPPSPPSPCPESPPPPRPRTALRRGRGGRSGSRSRPAAPWYS